MVRITGTTATSIKGIVAPSKSQLLVIINTTDKNITFVHNSTEAAVANRIAIGGGADETIRPDESVTLVYDLTSTKWVASGGFGGEEITVDATLIDGSTNPVQGNAVFDALAAHNHDSLYTPIAHNTASNNPHFVTKAQVGLSNVDNTTDLAKPVSTATQNALNLKADTTALHAHANKALLDTYTQTEANLADAVTKKHAHTNKAELDKIPATTSASDENKVLSVGAGDTLTWVTGGGGGVVLGETETTAYRGDRGKIAYDKSHDHLNKTELDKIPATTSANDKGKKLLVSDTGDALEWVADADAPYMAANRTTAISFPVGWTTVAFENVNASQHITFNAGKDALTFAITGIVSVTISHQGGTGYESDTAWRVINSDATVIATGQSYVPSATASSSTTILFDVADKTKTYSLQIGRSTSTFDIAAGPTIDGTQLPNIKFQIFSADKVGPQGPRGADGTPADRKELEFKTGTADDYTTPKVYTMWEGTEAQYNAITTKDANTRYWITDDTTGGGGGAVADDTAYGASWDGNTDAATKNVLYDKIETIIPSVPENLVTDWSGNWGHYADGTYIINSVFYKDPITGLVFINMTAWNTGATSASVWSVTPICTIPVGYRPVAAWVFCGASSSEGGLVTRLDMQSNGAMRIYTGKGRWVTANFVFKGA